MKLYNYDSRINQDYNIEEKPGKNIITFKSPFISGVPENDNVYSELFLSGNQDTSLVILLHGFATKKDRLKNYFTFMDKLIQRNINCAFINLPFHLNRTPGNEISGERLIYYDDSGTLNFFHQAVVDVRKFIEIVTNNFKFKDIIICGLSLGSLVAVISMAFEKRISKGIFLIGGGNWSEIHWNSILRFILKGNCISGGRISKEKCMEFYSSFPGFLEEMKNYDINNMDIGLENVPGLKEKARKMCFLCDPLVFANKINPKKVLMINSKFDHYFSKKSSMQLWEELGRPKNHYVNRLHTSKIITNGKIFEKIYDFIIDESP